MFFVWNLFLDQTLSLRKKKWRVVSVFNQLHVHYVICSKQVVIYLKSG